MPKRHISSLMTFCGRDAGKERHIIMQAKGWHYARYP